MNDTQRPTLRLIPFNKLREQKGIYLSRSTLYERIKAGTFPQPVFLSPTHKAFYEHEIDAWLESLAREAPPDRTKKAGEARWPKQQQQADDRPKGGHTSRNRDNTQSSPQPAE